jgi:NADH-quinone oxidoreductase subunit N
VSTILAATPFVGPGIEWFALSPLLALLAGALLILLVGSLTPPWKRGGYAAFTSLTALVAGVLAVIQWNRIDDNGAKTLVGGSVAFDKFTIFAIIAICIALLLTSLTSEDEVRASNEEGPEIFGLFMLAAVGAGVMVASNDLILLFLGLETMSLALYTLAAKERRNSEGQEAGLKYFILGGFSSAFFLYGIALIYGATSSTNVSIINKTLRGAVRADGNDVLLLVGIGLLLIGLGFKVSAVPFHVWSPDVYQGSPTPVTGFMASVGKVAAFAAFSRVFISGLIYRADDWRPAVWVIAVATLVVGSVLAVRQTNVKRMLAYSSISHAGFMLIGIEAAAHVASDDAANGVSAIAVYLLLYAVLVCGTFAVVTALAKDGGGTELKDFAGAARRRPALALGLTVLLLSQAGVPLTSGFVAKFGVIKAAVEVESYAIAIIAMLSAVIAAYLYLRIMVAVWLADSPEETEAPARLPFSLALSVALAVGFTLVVGIYPQWVLSLGDSLTVLIR